MATDIVRVTKFDNAPKAKVVKRFVLKGRACIRVRYFDEAGDYNTTVDFYATDVVPA